MSSRSIGCPGRVVAGHPALVPGIDIIAALDEVMISPDLTKRGPSLIGRPAAALRDNDAPDSPRYAEISKVAAQRPASRANAGKDSRCGARLLADTVNRPSCFARHTGVARGVVWRCEISLR